MGEPTPVTGLSSQCLRKQNFAVPISTKIMYQLSTKKYLIVTLSVIHTAIYCTASYYGVPCVVKIE